MTQITTPDITLDARIAVDSKAQTFTEGLQKGFLGIRDRLQQTLFGQPGCIAASKSEPLSGYYASAYHRANASMPVTSFRKFGETGWERR
jgi:hypothetical protein